MYLGTSRCASSVTQGWRLGVCECRVLWVKATKMKRSQKEARFSFDVDIDLEILSRSPLLLLNLHPKHICQLYPTSVIICAGPSFLLSACYFSVYTDKKINLILNWTCISPFQRILQLTFLSLDFLFTEFQDLPKYLQMVETPLR